MDMVVMDMVGMIERTESVCPVCLRRVSAICRREPDGSVWMVKACPDHGEYREILWRGCVDYEEWRGVERSDSPKTQDCGHCVGLCDEHERDTCCTLLEVTARCNMHCRFCFAEPDGSPDPSLEEVKGWIQDLTSPGKTFLQLSGGEPTVRDDLPQIISWAKACGCKYIQLNTNGLRLAQDKEYGQALAEAGLDFVFLQFDGVTEDVYRKLRGRDMLAIKEQVIRNMAELGVGVTLVPVIVPGVNDHQVGEILRYAIAHSPVVRGVHYQPVSYFGRLPKRPTEADRYTLDQLIRDLVEQSGGQVPLERLQPSCCDHSMCGLHSDFAVLPGGILHPLSAKRMVGKKNNGCCATNPAERKPDVCCDKDSVERKNDVCCGANRLESKKDACCAPKRAEKKDTVCCDANPADKNRRFIGERWKRDTQAEQRMGVSLIQNNAVCCDKKNMAASGLTLCEQPKKTLDMTDMDTFLTRLQSHRFTVTAMAFQDAGNMDYERLRRCSLHVYRDGKKRPFCAAYLSAWGEN